MTKKIKTYKGMVSLNKKIVIIISLVLAILATVYISSAFYYKDKFLSNVYVNDVNVGSKTLKQADDKLRNSNSWDKMVIKSDTEEFADIKISEIDYKYVKAPELPKILNKQNKWKWPLAMFKKSVHSSPIESDYNKEKVNKILDDIEQLNKEAVNARVVYSNSSNEFVIVPPKDGINLTKEQLFDLVDKGIETRESEINIEKNIVKPSVLPDDKGLIAAKDKANEYLKLELKYDFDDREEIVDKTLLKDWIVVNEREVDVDAEKVREYVVELAQKYDTFGKARQITTGTGKNINVSGGSYGWMTQRAKTTDELIAHIKEGKNKTIKPVYSYEALIRKADDIGNTYLEIDLRQQMVYVYVDGELRIQTPTVTGDISKGYQTPPGVYPLNYKERNATLRGENYAEPVNYWMPFNGNIGLHDADWRNSFGGSIYQTNGSHGCINLPPANAKTIFDLVYPGMPVIVH